jgi:hypothetical protein
LIGFYCKFAEIITDISCVLENRGRLAIANPRFLFSLRKDFFRPTHHPLDYASHTRPRTPAQARVHTHTLHTRARLTVARCRDRSPPPRARSPAGTDGPSGLGPADSLPARASPLIGGLGSDPLGPAAARRERPGSLPCPRHTARVQPLWASSAPVLDIDVKINARLPEPEQQLQIFHPEFPARLVMLGHAAKKFWIYPCTLKRHLLKKSHKKSPKPVFRQFGRICNVSRFSPSVPRLRAHRLRSP